MDKVNYELIPVGSLIKDGNSTYVQLVSDFNHALKFLDRFSHLIVFMEWKENIEDEAWDERSGKNPCRLKNGLNKAGIREIAAKLLYVDYKNGIVGLDHADAPNGTMIFDLKPYFPCEDRVEHCSVPEFLSKHGEWRLDITDSALKERLTVNLPLITKETRSSFLNPIGIIKKTGTNCFVELMEAEEGFFQSILEFSHVKIIWWFDRFDKPMYRRTTQCNPPYENAPRTGIFATRSPVRPNPIAMTTARILEIDPRKKQIKLSGLDAFDKTPVLDVCPYLPSLDRVRDFKVPEWLRHWPEWLDDREQETGIRKIAIAESELERMKAYLDTEKIATDLSKNLFSDTLEINKSWNNDILIKGARQNNLKNITLSIPKGKMTVITGVSGSGKSSLAFETVYAESQRRFINSMLSTGAAQLEQMEKPDFDQIIGLPPAVAIEQKSTGRNPRSTVGTMTDIYDFLKLLFSKIGTRYCPECNKAVTPLKAEEISELLSSLQRGIVIHIRPFEKDEVIGELTVPEQDGIELEEFRRKIKKAVNEGLSLGNGAIVVNINRKEEILLQTGEKCYSCNRIFFELTPSVFSFNHPESMCPVCKGLGKILEVDADLIVSNPDISLLDGASKWWGDLRKFREKPNANWMKGEILGLAQAMGVDLELPWKELPENYRKQALYGSDDRKVCFTYENSNGRRGEITRPVEGAFNSISRLVRENSNDTVNKIAEEFMREQVCSGCQGERLAAEGRLVSIGKTRFPETAAMSVEELWAWVLELPHQISEEQLKISRQILMELHRKLRNLMEAGVNYLTLDRSIPTLSGGELQRLRIASLLGSGITNLLYILDEPSAGLHPKDHNRLIKMLKNIRDEGNTVLVVEHDADTMLASDKIIDIGPGAGLHGGYLVAEGTPEEIMLHTVSETGKYLSDRTKEWSIPSRIRKNASGWIILKGACCNNLKHIEVSFPLGVLTCVTGVSGSGKSSLVLKTLYPALTKYLNHTVELSDNYESIEGLEAIDKVISISQQPIGRTPRSNPATYTGVFDDIRSYFAESEEAKKRGFKQNKFSFNSKEGQCPVCRGEGRKWIDMLFMPDVWVECPVCHGKRFHSETLKISCNQKTIADVLGMNIEEAFLFFQNQKKIKAVLQTLMDVGLGYLTLGQSALTLSGGEAQRIKLAKELCRADTGNTIYLLDEPTAGLHFKDIQNLMSILHRITEAGNSVIVIEHNLEVIKEADWIIDLGPEGGNAGGYVIAQGTPEEVANNKNSDTGRMLHGDVYRTYSDL